MTQILSPWPDDEFEVYDDLDDDPRIPLTLTSPQQADLITALDGALRADGCDNTLRVALGWAATTRVPWTRLRRELEASGGHCDCEVLHNVFPGAVPE